MLGREWCIELESDLFLIEMTADREGRGVAILTPALVSGTTKLIGDPRPTLTSFLLINGRKNVFSTSRLSPFPVLMIPLLTLIIVASDDANSA